MHLLKLAKEASTKNIPKSFNSMFCLFQTVHIDRDKSRVVPLSKLHGVGNESSSITPENFLLTVVFVFGNGILEEADCLIILVYNKAFSGKGTETLKHAHEVRNSLCYKGCVHSERQNSDISGKSNTVLKNHVTNHVVRYSDFLTY